MPIPIMTTGVSATNMCYVVSKNPLLIQWWSEDTQPLKR